jgi:HAD superfamily hydrolase (TIGR01509 family)
MSKRTILFDLDGTLLLDEHSPIEQFLVFCERLGHPFNTATAARLERWQLEYWSHHDALEARMEDEGRERFWINYNIDQLKFLGLTDALEETAIQIDTWFRDEYVYVGVVPDDVRPTLTALRASGAVLGLVSNRATALSEIATTHNLADLFDFTLSAGEAQAWKPNPEIFQKALQMAGGTPESALYIGDNYYADVVGSRNAGLTAILIDRRGLFPDADCRVIKAIGELQSEVGPVPAQ